jgi:hypothetical protein
MYNVDAGEGLRREQVPNDAEHPETPARSTMLHMYSGMVILGLDWLLFSGVVITAGTATLLISVLGFFIGAGVVAACQRVVARDTWLASLAKGLIAGIIVGIPLPIFGTFVGGVIISLSGLSFIKKIRGFG